MVSGSIQHEISTPERSESERFSLNTPMAMTPGIENTMEQVQGWTANKQLYLLREMINDEEIRNKITSLLCTSKDTRKVFFAANTGKGNISTEKEVEALLETIHYSMDPSTLLVPNTTKKQFESVLKEKTPQIIVFSGHGVLPDIQGFDLDKEVTLEHSSLVLFDEEHASGRKNNIDKLLFSELITIIVDAYEDVGAPSLIVFSACHTKGIIKQLTRDERCTKFFKNTIVIGWETLVEDSAATELSIPLIKSIFDTDFTPIQVEDIYNEYYKRNELKIGDPDVDLKNIDMHTEIFLKDIDSFIQTWGPARTSWRFKPPEFAKKYPNCKHCNPSFTGIPYLYMKGEYIKPQKKTTKRLEYTYEDEDESKKARTGEPMETQ